MSDAAMDAAEILLVLAVILGANIVETVTGFAGTLLAMPFLMLLLGVDQARVVMNMVSVIVGAGILIQNRRHVNKKQASRIILFMVVGIVVGLRLYVWLPTEVLLKAYGVIIVGIAVKKLAFPKTGSSQDRRMDMVILMLAGVIHGMFVSGGALLVVYAGRALKDKNEFRSTLASVWVVLNSAIAVQQVTAGLYTRQNLELIGLSVIPLCAANLIGNKIHGKISQEGFMRFTYVLLFLSGASVLV